MRYLLAAEADKIQDFVFRSSRLREVVGASQLLARFCDDGLTAWLATQPDRTDIRVPVNDGGSFRVVFEGNDEAAVKDRARRFGQDLAELYRLTVDGGLSVAEPVALDESLPDDERFREANKAAGLSLRRAKDHRQRAQAEAHTPFVAFCASCGVALAQRHGRLTQEAESVRARYLCQSCQRKAQERNAQRQTLLGDFIAEVITGNELTPKDHPWMADFAAKIANQATPDDYACPGDADAVGVYDTRNYVAYLVADGNNMGEIFGACSETQIETLSRELTRTVRACLARPTRLFMLNHEGELRCDKELKRTVIPVLPLILGGDDLFTLLPAPYALDFAYRFCQAYEERMDALLREQVGLEVFESPTVAVAVVICKSKYPYTLAHARAETLLKDAKRRIKRRAAHTGVYQSAVNFEVILGNQLAGLEDDEDRPLRPSLRPYWSPLGEAAPLDKPEWGVNLATLIDQRCALRDVPKKRLMLLREQFESLPADVTFKNRQAKLNEWAIAVNRICDRSGAGGALRAALIALGEAPRDPAKPGHTWRPWFERPGETEPLAQGFPDLLEVWDYALNLGISPDEYEPQGEER